LNECPDELAAGFKARAFGATDIDRPHFKQNEESSGISSPQPGQNMIDLPTYMVG
jgi:hypothetical protein